MRINIEEMRKEPLKKERLAYNGETGNRIDVEIYLHPLRAIYKVGKEGNDTANLFDNLKSAVDKFNYLEGMELDGKIEWKNLSNEAKSVIEWVVNPITGKRETIRVEIGQVFTRKVPMYHYSDSDKVEILITEKLFDEICEYVMHDDNMDCIMSNVSLVFKLKEN